MRLSRRTSPSTFVLEAQTRQKGILDEVRLVETMDGWKIGKGR